MDRTLESVEISFGDIIRWKDNTFADGTGTFLGDVVRWKDNALINELNKILYVTEE